MGLPVVPAGMLTFGPLPSETLHICVDMQRVFAEDTAWHTPWMPRVLPSVRRLVQSHVEQTVFTRFMPPMHADELPGSWQRYYRRWHALTLACADAALFDLVPELSVFVPHAAVFDKRVYSPWPELEFEASIARVPTNALVISGAETDVCVLATVLGAVDRGYRVILATDAICSSSDCSHDALLMIFDNRFSQQVETAKVDEILNAWA